ncbi:Serine/threonine-protein kinase CHK1 [Nakaseomyces glabratus]|nr:Serine/threonine-protein kinase CHK1 [Nakaseomyces glabratus]KTB20800.1 Serine/threonine-protein kinase CHK1 [Nakaseomyces glabratus]KTB25085.1 Serine/threonine-protein kinase CHK1 [Nakaseomyces glabratus]
MVFTQESLPVIKDVELGGTIGEGSFGCVRSARLKFDSSVVVAVKFVHLPTCAESGLSQKDVSREVVLHSKCSKHANVLRVIDCNVGGEYLWIMLEMADGGDLFDKIEPDVGVDPDVAQFYFQQLIRALNYLHDVGVAHRDIKPENILLDKKGNLKLADFGLASQFRRKDGTLRVSTDQRGSPPYMAPEILSSQGYYANITDIWSAGVLLFVLLTGEIPWSIPAKEDDNYEWFVSNEGKVSLGPWERVELRQMNLLRKILQPDPSKRVSLEKLRHHPWLTSRSKLANSEGLCNNPDVLAKKLLGKLRVSLSNETYNKFTQDNTLFETGPMKFRATQPVEGDIAHLEHDSMRTLDDKLTEKAFTQVITDKTSETTSNWDNRINRWTQYMNKEQAVYQFIDDDHPSQHINQTLRFSPNKLTKFFTVQDMDIVLPTLEDALIYSGIRIRDHLIDVYERLCKSMSDPKVFPLIINIKSTDRRGGILTGSVTIDEIEDKFRCINFEKRTGDPLEWRRLFKRIAVLCRDIILIPN